jgi:hypothetical protein
MGVLIEHDQKTVLIDGLHEPVQAFINPQKIIATHIDPNSANESTQKVKQYFPDATCFTTLEEVVVYEKN